MGYGWRLRRTVMFATPDTMMWHFESDVDCILHPYRRYSNNGVDGWNERAGYAPALLEWYNWRPIRSLTTAAGVDNIREGGPGNLLAINRNTRTGLAQGWACIGRPGTLHLAGTLPYLTGQVLGPDGNPSMQTAANILDSLSYRSGARWWVSPWEELNYVRPQDLPAIDITANGPLNNVGRRTDFTTLSTMAAMLNTSVWKRNEESISIDNETNVVSQVIGTGKFINKVPITSSNPNGGLTIGRVTRLRRGGSLLLGGSATIVNISEGTYPLVATPSPDMITDIKYDSDTGTLVAPSNGAFTRGESVIFDPESMLVWGEAYQSSLLVHDPRVNPRNGIFIEPIYIEEAKTPWDAFNLVAKKLAEGADIDAIHCYAIGTSLARDKELALIRGRAVKFDSTFLNIRDGKALELSRASTFRMQRLKGDVSGKPDMFVTDLSMEGRPSFSYILNEVWSSVQITYRETLPTQGPGLQNPIPVDVGEYTYTVNKFNFTTPIKYIITKEELLSRIYQTQVHLELIRDAFLVNAPSSVAGILERGRIVIENLLQDVKDEYNAAWQNTLTGLPTSLKIWHDLDNQGVSVFDEKQLALTAQDVTLIDRIEELFGRPGDVSHYIAPYGTEYSDEGFYCRALRITPEGPLTQRYTMELYRFPPIITDGIQWAEENFRDIQRTYEQRFDSDRDDSAPQPLPSIPVPSIE